MSEPVSEFPADGDAVNWGILRDYEKREHPLANPAPATEAAGEYLYVARNVHHLLDLAGVPQGGADTHSIDARVLVAIIGMGNLRERLARITAWHQRETGAGGTVGDYCTECERRWPCDTRRMADGTYSDSSSDYSPREG